MILATIAKIISKIEVVAVSTHQQISVNVIIASNVITIENKKDVQTLQEVVIETNAASLLISNTKMELQFANVF